MHTDSPTGRILHEDHHRAIDWLNALEARLAFWTDDAPASPLGDPDRALLSALAEEFGEALEQHFALEEELFPAIAAAGAYELTADLAADHEELRPIARRFARFCALALREGFDEESWPAFRHFGQRLVEGLVLHIQKEETTLLAAIDALPAPDPTHSSPSAEVPTPMPDTLSPHRNEPANEPVFDVQAIPPYQRHQVIIDAVQGLRPGEAFALVNDHDPRPLHLQLRALFGNVFAWEYQEQGPEVWRVRISKLEAAASTASGFRLLIERSGRVLAAEASDRLGPAEDGALVCEVTDCPPGTTLDDVIDLMWGVVPPPGMLSIPYDRLVARRGGSCCGGMCG